MAAAFREVTTDLQWRHIPLVRPRSRSLDSSSQYSGRSDPVRAPPKGPDFLQLRKFDATHIDDYNEVPTYPDRPHFEKDGAAINASTLVVAFDGCPGDPHHPSSMPIYQTATFVQPSVSEFGPYDYTRSGNPTRTALETLVAKLEGAYAAFAFTSGMSALATLTHLLSTGDEIIACADLYGGMHRLLSQCAARQGLQVRFVDTTNLKAFANAISHRTALVHVETPSNPLMRITDLQELSKICARYGALLSVDATMMTPILMQPLKLGVDIVMHSATKFFCGHSDTMAGFLATAKEDLAKRIAFLQNAEGTALAPFDCWLLLRGMKTMVLRVEKQQENAVQVASFLKRIQCIETLNYAGEHNNGDPTSKVTLTPEQYDLHMKQTTGGGSVISFTTGNVKLSQRIVDAVRLFKITVSFGSCNSLVEMPCLLSHASIPAEKRTLPADLIRLSIGIENARDMIADLRRAFELALSDVPNVREPLPTAHQASDDAASVGSAEACAGEDDADRDAAVGQ